MDELWLIAAEGAEDVDPLELPGVGWLFEAPASGRGASDVGSPEHPEFAETRGVLDAIK